MKLGRTILQFMLPAVTFLLIGQILLHQWYHIHGVAATAEIAFRAVDDGGGVSISIDEDFCALCSSACELIVSESSFVALVGVSEKPFSHADDIPPLPRPEVGSKQGASSLLTTQSRPSKQQNRCCCVKSGAAWRFHLPGKCAYGG